MTAKKFLEYFRCNVLRVVNVSLLEFVMCVFFVFVCSFVFVHVCSLYSCVLCIRHVWVKWWHHTWCCASPAAMSVWSIRALSVFVMWACFLYSSCDSCALCIRHLWCHHLTHTWNRAAQHTFFDGYCSTVQGLLDWFEVDLGFTWAFIYSNRFVCSVCFLFSSDSHMKSGSTAPVFRWAAATDPHTHMYCMHLLLIDSVRGVGLGSSTIFKKFNEPYAPS